MTRGSSFRKVRAWFLVLLLGAGAGFAVPEALLAQPTGASELRMRRIIFFNRFEQGKSYFQAGHFLESAAYFRSLMQSLDDLPPFVAAQVRYYYAASLEEQGILASAAGLYEDIIGQTLSLNLWADTVARYIRTTRELGNPEAVDEIWQKALRRVPTPNLLDPIRWEAALSFKAMDKPTVAISVLEPIRRRSRYYGPAQYYMAVLLQQMDRVQAAVDTFGGLAQEREELASWDKQDLADISQLAMARLLFDQGDYSRALVTYRKIGRDFVERPQALFEMAWCYASLDQYPAAVEQLVALINEYPYSEQASEAILLSGYFRMQAKNFAGSYSTFVTAETEYLKLAKELQAFLRRVPSPELLGETILSPAFEQLDFPPQVQRWIDNNDAVVALKPVKNSIDELKRALSGIQNDIQEVQILTAAYGASFRNPLTLELRIRDDVARSLANIQRQILELMARPFRDDMRYTEYAVFNRSQQVLDQLLDLIDNVATDVRAEAIDKQDSLHRISDFLRLIAPESFGMPEDPAINDVDTDFKGRKPIEIYRDTLEQRQGLSDVLLGTAVEIDALWQMVTELVKQQREILEAALRGMGVWGKHRFLIDLSKLYEQSIGLQRLVDDLSGLLLQTRRKVLDDVMAASQAQANYVRRIEEVNDQFELALGTVRYRAYAEAARRVAFNIRETGVGAAIGKLDLNWRIHKNEQQLKTSLLETERQRDLRMKGLYKRIEDHIEQPREVKELVLPEAVVEQLGQDAESDELLLLIKELQQTEMTLGTATFVNDRLKDGSESVLHIPGTLKW